jgi:hypothetical protein
MRKAAAASPARCSVSPGAAQRGLTSCRMCSGWVGGRAGGLRMWEALKSGPEGRALCCAGRARPPSLRDGRGGARCRSRNPGMTHPEAAHLRHLVHHVGAEPPKRPAVRHQPLSHLDSARRRAHRRRGGGGRGRLPGARGAHDGAAVVGGGGGGARRIARHGRDKGSRAVKGRGGCGPCRAGRGALHRAPRCLVREGGPAGGARPRRRARGPDRGAAAADGGAHICGRFRGRAGFGPRCGARVGGTSMDRPARPPSQAPRAHLCAGPASQVGVQVTTCVVERPPPAGRARRAGPGLEAGRAIGCRGPTTGGVGLERRFSTEVGLRNRGQRHRGPCAPILGAFFRVRTG